MHSCCSNQLSELVSRLSRVCFLVLGIELMASVGFRLEDGTLQFEDGTIAFRSLDLTLEPGQLNVILGPSGCGKTTLLRVLGGLLPLTTGALTFHTSSPATVTELPKTSFCFQEPRLLPWRNVCDNIALPGVLSGGTAGSTVEELLKQVELSTEHLNLLPSALSGGMQMRVSLARALYHQPELLLLDEPFAALDELTRSTLDDLLLDLIKINNTSAIMVTHSVAEAVYLADRIWILSPHPGELRHIYTSPFGHRDHGFRASREFAEAISEVHRLLAEAMGAIP